MRLPLLFAVLATPTLAAQQPPAPPPRVAASSFASTELHVDQRRIGGQWYPEDGSLTGPSRIAIAYGQPHARGRKIEGGLIPLDTVWRFGANTATQLHTDLDITLGSLAVPHGDYSLFLLSGKTGCSSSSTAKRPAGARTTTRRATWVASRSPPHSALTRKSR